MDVRRIATVVVLAMLATGAVVVSQEPADVGAPARSAPAGASPPVTLAPSLPGPVTLPPSTPEPSRPTGAAVASPDPDCPLTRPDPPFLAPKPWPSTPPPRYRAAWYGTPDLWTMLSVGGEVWIGLPLGPDGYGQKTFWFSVRWPYLEEIMPEIMVTGRRLDGPGDFRVGPPGTNAGADFGEAMLVGVDFPSPGCWELTGSYRGATLSYVVWVGP